MNKEEMFIKAYVWLYGSTKAKAKKVYKESHPSYINEIIFVYRIQCEKSFYND